MHTDRLNLTSVPGIKPGIEQINLRTTDSFTGWIFVGLRYALTADVQIASAHTWSSAVVGMEWSVSNAAYARANTFSPVVSFTSAVTAIPNIDIAGMIYVRFRVTTAEAANDPSAQIVYMIQ